MSEWIKSQYKGLRYRESTTDFIGVGRSRRPRRYYMMTYKWEGKTVSESLGWEGEYIRGEEEACNISRKLSNNRKDNKPPFTLKEYRQQNEKALEVAKIEELKEVARNITFSEVFAEQYFPQIKHNRRNPKSTQREEALFRLWIAPVIGGRALREIMPLHLEKIKKDMTRAGRAARSIQYCLAVIRQVFNYAISNNLFIGKNPAGSTGGVKRPTLDNRRTRFLTRQEAADLLTEIAGRSSDVHDMTMFSLYTGARAGEVFNLQWVDVDLSQGVAILKDTKSGKNRHVFLTKEVKDMLTHRRTDDAQATALVFPGRNGVKIVQISDSFNRAVDKLELNEGVTDRRQKVTFHTLRHSFASWLAMDGVDLYHIKELLGHSDLKLTERYSHLSESVLKQAAMRINQG